MFIKQLIKVKSIRFKALLVILIVSVISVVASTAVNAYYGMNNIKDKLDNEVIYASKIVGNSIRAGLLFNNDELIAKNLENFAAQSSIDHVCLYSNNKKLITSYSSISTAYSNQCVKDANVLLAGSNSTLLPINDGSNVIGYFLIFTNKNILNSFLSGQIYNAFFAIIGICLFVALPLSWLLQRRISNPITKLAQQTRYIEHEKLDRISYIQEGEIEQIKNAFESVVKLIDVKENTIDSLKNNIHINNYLIARQIKELFASAAILDVISMNSESKLNSISLEMMLRFINQIADYPKEVNNIQESVENRIDGIEVDDLSIFSASDIVESCVSAYFPYSQDRITIFAKNSLFDELTCFSYQQIFISLIEELFELLINAFVEKGNYLVLVDQMNSNKHIKFTLKNVDDNNVSISSITTLDEDSLVKLFKIIEVRANCANCKLHYDFKGCTNVSIIITLPIYDVSQSNLGLCNDEKSKSEKNKRI